MYQSEWHTADGRPPLRACDGCDCLLLEGNRYLNVKFTLEDGTNVVKLKSIFLCAECIEDFGDLVDSPEDPNEPV